MTSSLGRSLLHLKTPPPAYSSASKLESIPRFAPGIYEQPGTAAASPSPTSTGSRLNISTYSGDDCDTPDSGINKNFSDSTDGGVNFAGRRGINERGQVRQTQPHLAADVRQHKQPVDRIYQYLPPNNGGSALDTACAALRANLIGRLAPVETPFGSKPLVYADWTASGRPVKSIENFMNQQVLPRYGNTHTTSSETGAQTTAFREEARQIIARCLNAKCGSENGGDSSGDVVIFTGSGTTAAVAKLVSTLSLDRKKSRTWRSDSRPVVFIGPFEHHSNILPWRESCADVVQIAENAGGGLDLEDLDRNLKAFSRRRLKIGSFAAASNLTGALEDTDKITRILHGGGALAFWDYATAAPYVDIDMNPPGFNDADEALSAKDAVFISGHKFLGGAGTPGLLVCKKKLFTQSKTPVVKGGGTVLFVSHKGHTYLSNIEEREEGGTPDILGSIRLGLVFQMKEKLGSVEEKEERLTHLGLTTLRSNPGICLLGDTGRKRLPIFSFLIRHGNRFLHHNFVCALLNDLFGVQARAGCQCAGPYGIRLLTMPDSSLPKIKKQIEKDAGILKPGFCRLSLTFFMSDAEAKYILDAVMFVADHGASFLPLYEANLKSSEWKFSAPSFMPTDRKIRPKLNEARYGFSNRHLLDGPVGIDATPMEVMSLDAESAMFGGLVDDASNLAVHVAQQRSGGDVPRMSLDREGEAIRWFYFPHEKASLNASRSLVVQPKLYGYGQQGAAASRSRDAPSPAKWLNFGGKKRAGPAQGEGAAEQQIRNLVARLQAMEAKLSQQAQQQQQQPQPQRQQQPQQQQQQLGQRRPQKQPKQQPVTGFHVEVGPEAGALTGGGLGDSCYF